MSGKEAKETLEAVGGLLVLIQVTCMPENDSEHLKELFNDYHEAVKVAKDAIDLMDNKIDIQSREK